jgi:hypothetical protein
MTRMLTLTDAKLACIAIVATRRGCRKHWLRRRDRPYKIQWNQ